eukprot:6967106-Prymnesium_polylepis.1
MCVILCCVTGSEHAVATWLSSFGVEVGQMSEETSAPSVIRVGTWHMRGGRGKVERGDECAELYS